MSEPEEMITWTDSNTSSGIPWTGTNYTSSWVSGAVTEEQFKAWTAKLLAHIEDLQQHVRRLEDRLNGR